MPKSLHDKLDRQARKKGLKWKRKDAYVHGTMTNIRKRRERKKH